MKEKLEGKTYIIFLEKKWNKKWKVKSKIYVRTKQRKSVKGENLEILFLKRKVRYACNIETTRH